MVTTFTILNRVRAFCLQADVPRYRIARKAGLPDGILAKVEQDDWNPTVSTLERLRAVIPEEWEPGDAIDLKWFATGEAAA